MPKSLEMDYHVFGCCKYLMLQIVKSILIKTTNNLPKNSFVLIFKKLFSRARYLIVLNNLSEKNVNTHLDTAKYDANDS